MRILKFFSLVAIFTLVATYAKAEQIAELEPSSSFLQKAIAFSTASCDSQNKAGKYNKKTDETIPDYDQGYAVTEEQMMSGYNSPARIDVKGYWDVFVKGSYLYWQAKEAGLSYGVTIPTDASNAVNSDFNALTRPYKINDLSFEYQSGFKVAFGTNLGHDNWIAMIEYIRLTGSNSGSANRTNETYISTPSYIFPLWLYLDVDNARSSNIASTWDFRYNMLNFEFARPYYVGKNLTFKPHMGLTGGWIDQEYKSVSTNITNTYTLFAKAESDSWLVGPRFGVDSSWLLGAGFSLEADVAGSLVYQRFTTTYKQQRDYYSTFLRYYVKDHKADQFTPVLESTVGLSWGTYFASNDWHFSMQALYDFVYYFQQNHMRKVADNIIATSTAATTNSKVDDLWFNGLTISARFDF